MTQQAQPQQQTPQQGYPQQPMQQQYQQPQYPQQQMVQQKKPNKVLFTELISNKQTLRPFQLALGEHSDTFIASLIDIYTQDSDLQKCEPKEVIQEALKAANLNLPLVKSLGLAWLIPRNVGFKQPDGTKKWKVVPCFQIGYQGWKKLALNAGDLEYLNADKVYEGELVRYNKLKGTIDIDASGRISDTIIGYFAHFQTLKGYKHTEYMTIDEMCEFAKMYGQVPKEMSVAKLKEIALQDKNTKTVGWVGNFTAMAKKTVLTKLIKGWSDISTQPRIMMAIDSDVEDVSNVDGYNSSRPQAETINLSSDMYQEIQSITPTATEELPKDLTEPQF